MPVYDTVFEALADKTRREVLDLLRAGPRSVGELVERLPVSQPAVSQHLKVLRRAGLVAMRPEGTRRIYRVSPRGLEALKRYIESFWSAALASFADVPSGEPVGGDND